MAILLFLITVCGTVAAVIVLVISLVAKKTWLRNFIAGAMPIWLTIYAIALFASSATSREHELPRNDAKEFCGFYLDCHLHVTVTDVRTSASIGGRRAWGIFLIATVKVFSDAKNPAIKMRLLDPQASVVDDAGNLAVRDIEAENLLPTGSVNLGDDIRTTEPLTKELVFDLPANVTNPRLDIRDGYGIDRVIESVLIGDEDSLFHKRTFLSLVR